MPPRRRAAQRALRALPGFQGEINSLPDLATRKLALDMLVLVRDELVRGQPLDARIGTRDISDCYRLHFDPSGRHPFKLAVAFDDLGACRVALRSGVGQRLLQVGQLLFQLLGSVVGLGELAAGLTFCRLGGPASGR